MARLLICAADEVTLWCRISDAEPLPNSWLYTHRRPETRRFFAATRPPDRASRAARARSCHCSSWCSSVAVHLSMSSVMT